MFTEGYASLTWDTNGSDWIQAEWSDDDVWLALSVDGSAVGDRLLLGQVPRAASTVSANGQIFSAPGGAFELVEYATTMAVTSGTYDGSVSYSGALGTWVGRPATTAICQELMGSGARLCEYSDHARLVAAGAVNAYGESDPDKITIPSECASGCWLSSGGQTDLYYTSAGSTKYGDCEHFSRDSSTSRGARLRTPYSGYPYGRSVTGTCNPAPRRGRNITRVLTVRRSGRRAAPPHRGLGGCRDVPE